MAASDTEHSPDERIARWVRDHALSVRGYLLAMVRRADVADDLLQEVFHRAWQARDRYREQGQERAFLLRIADRLVIDRSRRFAAEINVDDATWQEIEPAAAIETPLESLAQREVNTELTHMLEALTPAQKRVLLLRYFGDLPFEEIAAALDCPLSTALSHCRRGLLTLRKLMTNESNLGPTFELAKSK